MYDAIIAGASFAGLSLAKRLKGKILLIEKNEIGAVQTSACCTLYDVLEKLDCQDSALQGFDTCIIHVLGREHIFKFENPFYTFDFRKFCLGMLKDSDAEVVRASVKGFALEGSSPKGLHGHVVVTDAGEFEGRCIIDCTGWRAILASSLNGNGHEWRRKFTQIGQEFDKEKGDFVNKNRLTFAFETVLDYEDDKLHFYWCPNTLRKGITWVFPAGQETRFGIGSYAGETTLKSKLSTFLNEFSLEVKALHGGYFPHRLREPTMGHLFLVGDSAGHCLPLTGEGIRTALYFGEKCGQIVQQIIDKKITLEEGLAQYRDFVLRHRGYYARLFWLQEFFAALPDSWMNQIYKVLSKKAIFSRIMREYENFATLLSAIK